MKNYVIYYMDGKEEKSRLIIRMRNETQAMQELFSQIGFVFVTKIEERKL